MSAPISVLGKCLTCGDEWWDVAPVAVCPECGGTDVFDLVSPMSSVDIAGFADDPANWGAEEP